MLVMIYEFLQGDASTWAPYFKVLPRSFDTLMFWSEEELAELQGSAVINKIGKQGAEELILGSIAPIVRSNHALFPPIEGLASYEGDAGTQVLLNLAHTMGSLIMAYAFDVEKPENEDERDGEDGYMTDEEEEQSFKGMVPLADILNADADRNNVSSSSNSAGLSLYIYLTISSRHVSSRKKNPWS
jgi:SET domain-containing protein 6